MEEVKKEADSKIVADFAKYVSQSIADQIKQADTKAFGTIGIIGISISALLGRLYALKGASGVNGLWLWLFIVSAVLIVLSVKLSVAVVFPRGTKVGSKSMTYFKGIILFSEDEFASAGKSLSSEATLEASYRQIHQLSKIAERKYDALRKAMIMTAIAVTWTVFTLLFS